MHLNMLIPGNKQSTEQRPKPQRSRKPVCFPSRHHLSPNLGYLLPHPFISAHHHMLPHRHDCSSGKAYVYETPRMFNYELVENCNELDPWKATGCKVVANGGFGLPTKVLESVVPENLLLAWY